MEDQSEVKATQSRDKTYYKNGLVLLSAETAEVHKETPSIS